MLTLFWGGEVLPGKPLPFVPPPEAAKLRLTQASLSSKAPAGAKVTLSVRVGEDGPMLQLAVLREDRCENTNLDVLLDHYSEFVVEGDASVHIVGYLCPDSEEDPDGGPYSLEDIMEMQQMGMLPGVAGGEEDDDEEDGDEYGSDEDMDDDEDDDHPLGVYGEDDDDSEDYDSEDDDQDEETEEDDYSDDDDAQPHTIIEELPDEPKTPKRPLALEAPKEQDAAAGKKKDNKKRSADAVPELVPAKKSKGGADAKAAQQESKQKVKEEAKQKGKQQDTKTQAAKQKQDTKTQAANGAAKPVATKKNTVRRFENGFMIEELSMGQPDGKLAANGKKVAVQYTGRLASNNKVFDSSKGKPFRFTLGIGEVVKGFDRGVQGMRVGDKRRVTIPPSMGYGTAGAGKVIPPNATLVFDLELVEVK